MFYMRMSNGIRLCSICGSVPSPKTQSKKITPDISQNILKYGGFLYTEGLICRNCQRKLETLHAKTLEFKRICLDTAQKITPDISQNILKYGAVLSKSCT